MIKLSFIRSEKEANEGGNDMGNVVKPPVAASISAPEQYMITLITTFQSLDKHIYVSISNLIYSSIKIRDLSTIFGISLLSYLFFAESLESVLINRYTKCRKSRSIIVIGEASEHSLLVTCYTSVRQSQTIPTFWAFVGCYSASTCVL